MKTNFALSLSHKGIQLLHASAGGWQVMGEVDPASDTLSDDLAVLRRTATALEPVGLRTALIIPASQIRYLVIDTPGMDADARLQAARKALDGATPYAVSELSIDICEMGDQTYVAAVAHETLNEAEDFGQEHGFNPVMYTARPDDTTYPGEPFFGLTDKGAFLARFDTPEATLAPPQQASAPTAPETPPSASPDFISVRRTQTFSDPFAPIENTPVPGQPTRVNIGFAEAQETFQAKPTPLPTSAPESAPRPNRFNGLPQAEPLSKGSQVLRKVAAPVAAVLFAGGVMWASGILGNAGIGRFVDWPLNGSPEAQFAEPLETVADPSVTAGTVTLDHADVDAAVQEALNTPFSSDPADQGAIAPLGQDAQYAVTGIWTKAPDVPKPPAMVDLENLYVTSVDPVQIVLDAVALPAVTAQSTDLDFEAPGSPAPAGTQFSLDDRGLVRPSAEGTLSQDGIMIFAGAPPVIPPRQRAQTQQADPTSAIRAQLSQIRPRLRPTDLSETNERATLGGLSRAELAEFRPRLRPAPPPQPAAARASLVPLEDGSSNSLLRDTTAQTADDLVSLRPEKRPANFALTVARIQQQAPKTPVVAASVAPRTVTPSIPSSASATREATQENAINLRRVNLIGVYGKPSDRRALVRLGNGRYQKVEVGDKLDGGQISAIGDSELRYQKRGRNIVLTMPQG